ncbi:MAG: hypothetical protein ACOYXC_17560 [Candidatus Rifleibacteriota bacterium]
MICEKFKEKIRETPDLEILEKDQEFSRHLEKCRDCCGYFAYERSLRQGFANMADELPPAQLAARIFAIPEENKVSAEADEPIGLIKILLQFFSGFPLKTAAVSCMIGFLAAIMLQNQTVKAPENFQGKKEVITGRAASEPKGVLQPDPGSEPIQLAKVEAPPSPTPEVSTRQSIPLKDKSIAREESSESIPGAISFSLAEDEVKSQGAGQNADFAEMKKSAPVPSMAISMNELESDADVAVQLPEEFSAKMDKEIARAAAEDPRSAELENLLKGYSDEIRPGFLQLRDLAARGIIESDRLSYFSPPPGMGWFVEVEGSEFQIVLKNEK